MAAGPTRLTPQERLKHLEKIENDITLCLQSAGLALQELSKDKPAVSSVTTHTSNFVKTLQGIENGMSQQINYLMQYSAGTAHDRSAYGPQKDLHMAIHRMQHVKSRLEELEKHRMNQVRKQQLQAHAASSQQVKE